MSDETNLYSLNEVTPESAWLHGGVEGRAWLSGSINAKDKLDISAEFDAALTARVGASVGKTLGSLDAQASGAAHAGLRMQVATPLDLFTGAGLVARVRLEASLTGLVQVRGTLSMGILQQLVMDAVPVNVRRYARVLLEEATVSAGVWARGTFAAMAVSELVSTVSLFPTDGSSPGVTAWFRYGYSWGFGGGWGTVVNLGFTPKKLLERLSLELVDDISEAARSYRRTSGLPADDPRLLLTEVAQILLPAVLGILVDLGDGSVSAEPKVSLVDRCTSALRLVVRQTLIPRLGAVCAEHLSAMDLTGLPEDTVRQSWARGVAAAADVQSGMASLDALVETARFAVDNVRLLPPSARAPVVGALRCAVAITLLADEDLQANRVTLAALFGRAIQGRTAQEMARAVIVEEFAQVCASLAVLPTWITSLVGDVTELTSLLLHDDSRNSLDDLKIIASLVRSLVSDFFESEAGESVLGSLPTEMRSSLRAASVVLAGFCESLSSGGSPDLEEFREGLTACVLTLLGAPLTQAFKIMVERGLEQVSPSFRTLAALVDGQEVPPSINSSWEQLGRSALGVTMGLPTSLLLRRTADKVDNWCAHVLPEELGFLLASVNLGAVCDGIVADGLGPALATHRADFRAALALHCVNHVVDTIAFAIEDSLGLFPYLVEAALSTTLRSLVLLAVASFKAFEDSLAIAERGAVDLQTRIKALEDEIGVAVGHFLEGVGLVAKAIRDLSDQLGHRVVDWIREQGVLGAATSGISDAILSDMVDAVLGVLSGGLLQQVESAAGWMADALDVVGESILRTAESTEGAAIGVRALVARYWAAGNMRTVQIPIVIEVPNPVAPFILPPIKVEVCRVSVPGTLIGDVALTLLMDSLGVGPMLSPLDQTVDGIRLTRVAVAQLKAWIDGSHAAEQRDALNASEGVGPLSIEILTPEPNSATDSTGEVAFLVRGANVSFVDPSLVGLPPSIASRIQVRMNGREVTRSTGRWDEVEPGVLRCCITFSTSYGDASQGIEFVKTPVAVVVVVTDSHGDDSATESWQFVPAVLQRRLIVECVARDSADSGRSIDALGGTTEAGERWRIPLPEALLLQDQGTAFFVRRADGALVELVQAYRRGTRYLHTKTRSGAPRLGNLPDCPG